MTQHEHYWNPRGIQDEHEIFVCRCGQTLRIPVEDA